MPNELLWIIFLLFDLAMVIVAYRLWGRIGLYAMIAGSVIICNIQVVVVVEMFGLTATLGNIVYASIFLATDILSENYGKREARKGIWIGFFCLFWMIAAMQIAIQFKPSGFDRMMPHLTEIFSFLPRIAIASLLAYLISQHHDVWAFHKLKARTGGRLLWLRNNLSTAVSQLLDSVAFTLIAFWGVFPASELFQIVVTTYLFKVIVAGLDTPFIYLARKIKTAVPAGEGKLI
ncbi:MAG: queuosine precursor transporter [candidate division Zixibacteria bacterium]|nr:queuosine precursor transporter [candidate division Zixibacteria bacterium]